MRIFGIQINEKQHTPEENTVPYEQYVNEHGTRMRYECLLRDLLHSYFEGDLLFDLTILHDYESLRCVIKNQCTLLKELKKTQSKLEKITSDVTRKQDKIDELTLYIEKMQASYNNVSLIIAKDGAKND